MLKLNNLLINVNCKKTIGDGTVDIYGVKFDSRKVEKGDLFIATRGTAVDGHEYINTAIERGAVAVLCEELPTELKAHVTYITTPDTSEALGQVACTWYDYPSSKLTLVGVTGTNGKTTIVTLLYQLFRKLGYKAGLLSTVVNYVNDKTIEATHTTPDALTINELLSEMADAGCEYAFMEVSSHAIVQNRISGLNFAGGIFTNLTRDHIDYHETFDNYLKAKKRFFDELSPESFALTNIDDKNGMVMLQNTKARKYTYTLRSMGDFKTKILESGFDGMLLNMNDKEVHVSFVGKFNASNLTAVYGTAMLLWQNELETLRIISALQSVSGRFETLYSPTGYMAIVDYAHTPDALNNVISSINQILTGKQGRLITVVGCGGNRDKGKRPIMAQEAVNGSWKAIFTSDNPRFEDPQAILDDMTVGLDNEQRKKTLVIVNRREAIRTACSLAQPGDIVLVAGKGHENYQIIQGEKSHFDDREEVKVCF
ncbi:UDP-N-acetylmuramoyl-L-alanyl-D-glutamate--2,6-diaminopimelate ligase [Paludibacter sp. 221]|uniref:UDP-N-acetylmuramoyl-L-alanyl-D-glutamate--2, 6-diaminopimelate ligase n=1 Tax=Paludibacter sp. 221 TaxID=2302939 RepID=UPI0013D723F1|nr:UDP-N-acetylmuramoyl-L-alanyl-D-glutamate--2,6-diaminopimelate ligase [Paludibacter sp. 221]NDV47572.1 UDP-N-acetylmuramoyl-L-alanyl-D-glutamate--2,6-diaminopimelate ligase [Paludibacter sp. 221]